MKVSRCIPHDWREWRRVRVLQLKQRGWRQRAIAEALGASEVSVSRWLRRAREGGPEALLSRAAPGHPPKLSPSQKRLIPEFLGHGPEAYGFHGQVWTCARIAKVIEEEFGVSYHKDHVGRLLRELHWTPQMPIRRAIQRGEEAIRRWRDEAWPDLRRRARRERRVLVFEDESGFYLLPGLVRTYAPEAHTPVIREKQTRDHLSVMGGMTPEGKVYTLARRESLNGLHSIEFLLHLLRVAGERLLVIWDGSPIHRREAVREFLAGSEGAVWVEALPGYAPDLNPWDEGGWNHLKHVEMRNLVCHDLEELHEQFHLAIGRLRQKPHLVQSFFAQAGLTLEKTGSSAESVGRSRLR
jgi:transposase